MNTHALALDCEMVGAGPRGCISLAARVSIVNEYYQCIYDTYVLPGRKVTDYRTQVSGIEPHHLAAGRPLLEVKKQVASLIKGGILVGHAVDKDLKVLGLCHPEYNVRDTSHYPPFQTSRGTPALRDLAWQYAGMKIQCGAHSSVRDARAAMKVYKYVQHDWEAWLEESDSSDESYDEYYY